MTSYNVQVVCTGNICRSPLAEYALRAAFEDHRLGDIVTVSSSGISDEEEGRPMDPRMARVAAGLGFDVSAHRARPLSHAAWETQDLFLAADLDHLHALRRWAPTPDHAERIHLLRSFDPAAEDLTEDELGIADPYYSNEDGFRVTRDQVLAAVPGVVDFVRNRLAAGHGQVRRIQR